MTESGPASSTGVATLPAIGRIGEDDHVTVATYLEALALEAVEGRDGWIGVADSSVTIYTYAADPAPDDDTLVIQDIQNAVLATTEVQTKEEPTVSLGAVDRGDPPICFWAGPQDLGISAAPGGRAGIADGAGGIEPGCERANPAAHADP
jgi:hypothetical protein